jgi:hypothetical protein
LGKPQRSIIPKKLLFDGQEKGVGEVAVYTSDVPGTIGAILQAAASVHAEPENLVVRRATLEDVFLDLTGRALRD